MDSDLIGRRRPAKLPPCFSPSRPTLIFLTVCTKDKRPLLANADAQALLIEAWGQSSWWRVGRYVLMPDHLHLFCSPSDQCAALAPWVTRWKWHYVRHNPVRADLVTDCNAWPWQGEVNPLAW